MSELSKRVQISDANVGYKIISKEMKKVILELHEAGLNSSQIGGVIGKNSSVVRYHITVSKKNGHISL